MIQFDVMVVPEDQRGQGIGTEVMKRLCEFADIFDQTIIISASLPVRDIPHSDEAEIRLVGWYETFGFTPSDTKELVYTPKPHIMCRKNIMERAPRQPFPGLDTVIGMT